MDSIQTKLKSEETIESIGLKPNRNLPVIKVQENLSIKSGKEIAKRILCLAYMYAISLDVPRKLIKSNLVKYGLLNSLSKTELKLLNKFILTKQNKIDIQWYTENIEILGYSISLWPDYPLLDFCDEDRQSELIPIRKDPSKFIEQAKILERSKIYESADLIYRLHWNAKRTEIGRLGKHSNDVYMERHKAINWIIGVGENWDNTPINT